MLASSAKPDEVDHYLDLLDARELVDAWTASGDVEATKPEPDLVQAAIEKAGTGEAVMVGDSTWDCEAAGRAGIETVAVLTGGFSEDELRDAGALMVFDSIAELRRASPRNSTEGWPSDLRTTATKRDFGKTPEPRGGGDAGATEGRFVVQEHNARSLHWDLRLEHDGVLVVVGPAARDPRRTRTRTASPCTPRTTRSSTSSSTGEIPKGEYGAGTMEIWDSGTYDAEKFRDDEVIATFHGERFAGPLRAVRTRAARTG